MAQGAAGHRLNLIRHPLCGFLPQSARRRNLYRRHHTCGIGRSNWGSNGQNGRSSTEHLRSHHSARTTQAKASGVGVTPESPHQPPKSICADHGAVRLRPFQLCAAEGRVLSAHLDKSSKFVKKKLKFLPVFQTLVTFSCNFSLLRSPVHWFAHLLAQLPRGSRLNHGDPRTL